MDSEEEAAEEGTTSSTNDKSTLTSKVKRGMRRAVATPPVFGLLSAMVMMKRRGKWDRAFVCSQAAVAIAQDPFLKAVALLSVAQCHRNRHPGDWDRSCACLLEAGEQLKSMPESKKRTRWLLRATTQLGDTMVRMRQYAGQPVLQRIIQEAEELLVQVRQLDEESKTTSARKLKSRLDMRTISMAELGEMYYYTGRWEQGETLLRELVPLLVDKLGSQDEMTIEAQRDLASMLVNQDKHEEAEAAYRVAREWNISTPTFGPEEQAAIDYNIAMCLSEQGRHAEAKEALGNIDLAVDLLHYANGEWTLKLVRSTMLKLHEYENVAILCRRFQHVLDGKVSTFGPTSNAAMRNLMDHITSLLRLGRFKEAIPLLRDRLQREMGDPHVVPYNTLWTRVRLAHALHNARFVDEGVYHYRKCLELEREAAPDVRSDCFMRNVLRYLAYVYEITQDKERALLAYSELQLTYSSQPAKPLNVWGYQWARGRMLTLLGKWDDALKVLLGPPTYRFGEMDPSFFKGGALTDEARKIFEQHLRRPGPVDLSRNDATEAATDMEIRAVALPSWAKASNPKTGKGSTVSLAIRSVTDTPEPGREGNEQTSKQVPTAESDTEAESVDQASSVPPEMEYTVQAARNAALGALSQHLETYYEPVDELSAVTNLDDESDEEEGGEDEDGTEDEADDPLPSVGALLREQGLGYPFTFGEGEKRRQFPLLPDTYEEMVRQRKAREERMRYPWRVALGTA